MHFGGLWLTFNIAIFQGRFPWFVWFLQKITLQQMLPYLSKCCKWYIKTERGLVVNVSVVSCPADVDRFRERFLVRLLSNMQHLQLHHWHHPYGTNSWSLLFLAGSCCQLSKSPYYPRVADEDFTLRFFPTVKVDSTLFLERWLVCPNECDHFHSPVLPIYSQATCNKWHFQNVNF